MCSTVLTPHALAAPPPQIRYPRSIDRMLILALMQSLWARMDPAGWASYISSGTLPGTPTHRVIHHYGVGDHQVTWLGAHAIAFSTDAAVFASNVVIGNQSSAWPGSGREGGVD